MTLAFFPLADRCASFLQQIKLCFGTSSANLGILTVDLAPYVRSTI